MVTIPTASGPVSGNYIAPVNFSTAAVDLGIPNILGISVKVNDINGFAIRSPDGSAYIVSDAPLGDDLLGASVELVVGLVRIPLVDVPISELNTSIAAALAARAQALGPLLGAPLVAARTEVLAGADLTQALLDTALVTVSLGSEAFDDDVTCFVAGTLISTLEGEKPIEHLTLGDLVATAQGTFVPVLWIARVTLAKSRLSEKYYPVLITKDALGPNAPHTDLCVSANHAISFDDVIVDAKALINGTSIRFMAMEDVPESLTYYHVETHAHEEIFANGLEVESFIDYVGRSASDNYAQYLETYGADRIIPEMKKFRISCVRNLPQHIRKQLGISMEDASVELEYLSA